MHLPNKLENAVPRGLLSLPVSNSSLGDWYVAFRVTPFPSTLT